MKIGSHVSNNGKEMLVGSINEAISYNANCLMLYLGAPQNTIRKPMNEWNIDEMKKLAKDANFDLEDIIVHAPYIVNPARNDEEKRKFAVELLVNEVKGVAAIGAKYLVLHPGSAVDTSREDALLNVSKMLNEINELTKELNTVICLETMAGKGNEVGRTFDELKYIIDNVYNKERVAVCFDTCHVNDAGYDIVNNYDEVMKEFDDILGLDKIKVFHVNDSKNPISSHKDRHENFGFGTIGFDTLLKVVNDSRFDNICHILETPYIAVNSKLSVPPYKQEIEMIKNGLFNPKLIEEIKENYN